MVEIRSSETLVNTYKTTRCHNSEDHNRYLQRREKLKSEITFILKLFNEAVSTVVFILSADTGK
jgi:hypothetical protein